MALEMEFDAYKADVRPQYREELRKVADFMKAHPEVTATVEGHTGNLQATPKLAMEMSQRRARNVARKRSGIAVESSFHRSLSA